MSGGEVVGGGGRMNRREFLRVAGGSVGAALCAGCAVGRGSQTKRSGEMGSPLACCGIDCESCEIRKAANDPAFAEELAARWRKRRPDARADWFRCLGCDGPEDRLWDGDCKIRACCKQKGYQNCSQCESFKCGLVSAFESDGYAHHKQAIQRLERLRDGGAKA
jgi:hypothetical protein